MLLVLYGKEKPKEVFQRKQYGSRSSAWRAKRTYRNRRDVNCSSVHDWIIVYWVWEGQNGYKGNVINLPIYSWIHKLTFMAPIITCDMETIIKHSIYRLDHIQEKLSRGQD